MNNLNGKFPTHEDHVAFRRSLAERYAAPTQTIRLPSSLDEVVDQIVCEMRQAFRDGDYRINLQVDFDAARFTDLPFAWVDPKELNYLDTLRAKQRLQDAFNARLAKKIDFHNIEGSIGVNDHLDRLVAKFTVRMKDGFDPMKLFTELRLKK